METLVYSLPRGFWCVAGQSLAPDIPQPIKVAQNMK
jgi:hypothetical protein